MLIKFGKWIAKHRVLILIIGFLMLIPSTMGYINTKINYDVLSYLPENLDTVKGQDIMIDEFGSGAFSMITMEGMETKDIVKLKKKMEKVDHVKDILWYDSVADVSVPIDMLPDKVKDAFNKDDATLMVVMFDDKTSSESTMEALVQLEKLATKQCYISGMTGIVQAIKDIAIEEMPAYVVIAAVLDLLVLFFATESYIVPFIFLLSIGMAILYNMGSNIFLGEISYITKALAAILQLGVTMDYSIFLLTSYEDNKKRFPGEKERAMGHAIANTFRSVVGSSITTIAGFIALIFMSFTLGRDIGIVMAKGVVFGVIGCITILPSLVLVCDKLIDKTTHKVWIPSLDRISLWITDHSKLFLAIFLIALIPAVYGNNHYDVYYNLESCLPSSLDSVKGNQKLKKQFDLSSMYVLMLKNGMSASEKEEIIQDIEDLDGVKSVIGLNSLVGPSVPDDMIPNSLESMIKSDNYEMVMVNTSFRTGTKEANQQSIAAENIVKRHNKESLVVGEAPLTKDLANVTQEDFQKVNVVSILAIFVIIFFVFKSISLPVILVSVIEFAIFVNMAISYYSHTTLIFVAGIVIGTIQLGATVDYAILMTTRYEKERIRGKSKKEAVHIAHTTSMKSILISGISLFAATFGVGLYSKTDMISSLCGLLSRGALISTIVVITILPAAFTILDPIICKTTKSMRGIKLGKNKGGMEHEV